MCVVHELFELIEFCYIELKYNAIYLTVTACACVGLVCYRSMYLYIVLSVCLSIGMSVCLLFYQPPISYISEKKFF